MMGARVVMGLMFFPRGGSAYVARYLSRASSDAGWNVSLVAGSLGPPGAPTDAATFFAGTETHPVDYTAALTAFHAGRSAIEAPIPMHPSYEDRIDAPDPLLASVAPRRARHLASVWDEPFSTAGTRECDVVHLHHLTPQLDALRRGWPDRPLLVHLHGTELKFIEAVTTRATVAADLGTTLRGMPKLAANISDWTTVLDGPDAEIARTTRWAQWQHGEFWAGHLKDQAQLADHIVVVSHPDQTTAESVLGVDPERIVAIPNGVDLGRFQPRTTSDARRRTLFRRWLVDEPQGWSEHGTPGTIAYCEDDLDRLLGANNDTTVLLSVSRFTAAKRIPLLIRAFAQARNRFDRPASLVVWGGSPGEFEGQHPVTVAQTVGNDGIFFAGWRGHTDLPDALAASDALVMASVNDSYPQTPLEAMAVGLPVIATKSGGFPSMINLDPAHPTGWLVAPDDIDALAHALIQAVDNPVERRIRATHALAHARARFSWAGLVPRFEEAYANAIAHHAQAT